MAILDDLKARRDDIGAKIRALTYEDDAPNVSGGDAAVDKVGKIKAWHEELKSLNELISSMDTGGAGGVIETIGVI